LGREADCRSSWGPYERNRHEEETELQGGPSIWDIDKKPKGFWKKYQKGWLQRRFFAKKGKKKGKKRQGTQHVVLTERERFGKPGTQKEFAARSVSRHDETRKRSKKESHMGALFFHIPKMAGRGKSQVPTVQAPV